MNSLHASTLNDATLRQRNALAVACIVLGFLFLCASVVALTKDREIVLMPLTTSKLKLNASGVSPDYLEAVTRDTAQIALNRTPENLTYWRDSLLEIAAPATRGKLNKELSDILRGQADSQRSQFVSIKWIRVDPDNLTSDVGGVLHTIIGSKEVRRQPRTWRFTWEYTGLSLKLKAFGAIEREGADGTPLGRNGAP